MTTLVNGQPAEWTLEIRAKWDAVMLGVEDPTPVSGANYFTPRPYVDQYNRGSRTTGFTYWRHRTVYQVLLAS